MPIYRPAIGTRIFFIRYGGKRIEGEEPLWSDEYKARYVGMLVAKLNKKRGYASDSKVYYQVRLDSGRLVDVHTHEVDGYDKGGKVCHQDTSITKEEEYRQEPRRVSLAPGTPMNTGAQGLPYQTNARRAKS